MPLPPSPRVQFRAGDLLPELLARVDTESEQALAQVADRDLHRYYHLLRTTLPAFTEAEASLLVDALNGIITEPHTAHLLWANISDALADGLAEKWGVDGPALVARLRALTPFEALSVADACERFWRGPYTMPSIADGVRAVGLVR